MELSRCQVGIKQWVKEGIGNAAISVVAGAGKSTTLKLVAQELMDQGFTPNQLRVIVFGRANKDDLASKFSLLGGPKWKESVSTLHSAGWSIVKFHFNLKGQNGAKISAYKYKTIAQEHCYISSKHDVGSLTRPGVKILDASDFVRLIDLVRLALAESSVKKEVDAISNLNGFEYLRYSGFPNCLS